MIGYWWDGSAFVVCTATMAPKVRVLEMNPKVALSIDTDTHPPHVLSVRGTASVGIVDGVPKEFLQASKKALPGQQWSQFEAQVRCTPRWLASRSSLTGPSCWTSKRASFLYRPYTGVRFELSRPLLVNSEGPDIHEREPR